MPRVVVTIDIAAPVEAVWALMCDPYRYPDFVDTTERMVEVPDRAFAVGYSYKEFGGIRPFLGESTWTVLELEPPLRQVQRGDDGMMTIDLLIEMHRVAGGTRLTHTLELRPRWYMAPLNAILWPLFMKKRVYASMEKTNQNVKRLIEASGVEGEAEAAAS
jgi:hypothetical protein